MDHGFSCTTRILHFTWHCVLCRRGAYGKSRTYCDRCAGAVSREVRSYWDHLAAQRPFLASLLERSR